MADPGHFRAELWASIWAVLLGVVMLTFLSVRTARAQVSPGPLSAAHRSLEGNQNCLRCHGSGKGSLDAQCLACHQEIATLREKERGLHAREAKGECARCHPDHAGADFALVHWAAGEPESFDHSRTGWTLEGKHARAKCVQCHRLENLSPVLRGLSKRADPGRGWIGLDPECRLCHQDPHVGRLGTDCSRCHNPTDWKATTKEGFDHARTRYPLQGLHAKVACEKCHDPSAPKRVVLAFEACRDCHKDPHGGKATVGGKAAPCESCHTVDGFKPSSFGADRHTKYRLLGKHGAVKCVSCHKGTPFEFHPASNTCKSCHQDAHGGQLAKREDGGACESCHRVEGWEQSLYGLPEHTKTGLPLQGAHERAKCGTCHGPERRNLPALPSREALGAAGVLFHPMGTACADCHIDPHAGRFEAAGERPAADGCRTCHTAELFRPSIVDQDLHTRLGAPLKGAHLAVPCDQCHAELKSAPVRPALLFQSRSSMFQIARPGTCAECHKTPHGEQFASRKDKGACDVCHDEETFRPASRFDHARDTRFSLAGAHAKVACDKCHKKPETASSAAVVVYHDLPMECRACHGSSVKLEEAETR